MPRSTIRCPVCGKWKQDSIDAGPCDECINGKADTSEPAIASEPELPPSGQGAEPE